MTSSTHALPKTIYAIQHLAFEDLGILEDTFYDLGYRIRYFEAGMDDLKQAFEFVEKNSNCSTNNIYQPAFCVKVI